MWIQYVYFSFTDYDLHWPVIGAKKGTRASSIYILLFSGKGVVPVYIYIYFCFADDVSHWPLNGAEKGAHASNIHIL